jgi:hypothetical protein
MKNLHVLFVLILMGLGFVSQAQVIVKVKPVAPRQTVVISHRNAPHKSVWIAGTWVAKGNTYLWKPGYYAKHRQGYRLIEGYWKPYKHGWVWVPGKWMSVRR